MSRSLHTSGCDRARLCRDSPHGRTMLPSWLHRGAPIARSPSSCSSARGRRETSSRWFCRSSISGIEPNSRSATGRVVPECFPSEHFGPECDFPKRQDRLRRTAWEKTMATSRNTPESIVREIKRKTRRVFNFVLVRGVPLPRNSGTIESRESASYGVRAQQDLNL